MSQQRTGQSDGPQVAKDVPADAKKPGGGEAAGQPEKPAH